MDNQSNTVMSQKPLPWRELFKLPRIALYDEHQRIWGYFLPEQSAMLKTRTDQQWYELARRLLAEQPDGTLRAYSIPYEDDKVRGEFFLTPWTEESDPPVRMSPERINELTRTSGDSGKTLTFEEVMDSLDRILLDDGRGNAGI